MNKRPFSTPPTIDGFEWLRNLGRGGFADVFLYQRLHPRSEVAVKVLLQDKMTTRTVRGFTEEANMMAQFAAHPSIVSVYQAGVAADGRPYLVMEYCPGQNLQERHKRKRFTEAETLQVGVKIAGAVETAHRAGILHRDIKPANILVSAYDEPQLSDFGISAAAGGADEMEGLSILWAPPEVMLSTKNSSPASDVYSLAATLYTLLANRTPFEIPGASNTQADVTARIHGMVVPSLGRADVSASMASLLRWAMAKSPADRPQSAAEFARALNRVQIEQGLPATPIRVSRELSTPVEIDEEGERTNYKAPRVIDAQPVAEIDRVHAWTNGDSGNSASDGIVQGTEQIEATNLRADETNTARALQQAEVSDETHLADDSPGYQPGAGGAGWALRKTAPAGAGGAVGTPPNAMQQQQQQRFELPARQADGPLQSDAEPVARQQTVTGQAAGHAQSPAPGRPGLHEGTPPAAPDVVRLQPGARRPRIRKGVVVGVVTAVVVLAATAVIGYVAVVAPPSNAQAGGAATSAPVPLDAVQPVDVVDLKGAATAGTVTFTWTNPAPRAGDTYLWRPVVPGESFTFEPVITPSVSVPPAQSGRTCIEVLLVRDGGGAPSEGVQGCAP